MNIIYDILQKSNFKLIREINFFGLIKIEKAYVKKIKYVEKMKFNWNSMEIQLFLVHFLSDFVNL